MIQYDTRVIFNILFPNDADAIVCRCCHTIVIAGLPVDTKILESVKPIVTILKIPPNGIHWTTWTSMWLGVSTIFCCTLTVIIWVSMNTILLCTNMLLLWATCTQWKKNLFCWWQINLWCKLFHRLHRTPNYRWLGEMKISENLDIMYGQIFQNFS